MNRLHFYTIVLILNCLFMFGLGLANAQSLEEFNVPGSKPEIFAPYIVSTNEHEHSFPSFSDDGKVLFWTVVYKTVNIGLPSMILTLKFENMKWSTPSIAEFSGVYPDAEGSFTPDGKRFFFGSQRPPSGDKVVKKDLDLWFVEKQGSGWTVPMRLNSFINTERNEMQPTIAANGNLYYVGYHEKGVNKLGIFRSEFKNGNYLKPELLGENINSGGFQWTPFIADDESFLLFSAVREEGYGSGDLYISFRNNDGTFDLPINLGPDINSEFNERFPYISPDKKYLFFVCDKSEIFDEAENRLSYEEIKQISNGPGNGYSDIYWVDINTIRTLKKD